MPTSQGPYDIGDDVLVEADFYVGGTLTTPSTLMLRVQPPSGAERVYVIGDPELVLLATGKYQGKIDIDAAGGSGCWRVRWESTGATAKGVEEQSFIVRATTFSNPL